MKQNKILLKKILFLLLLKQASLFCFSSLLSFNYVTIEQQNNEIYFNLNDNFYNYYSLSPTLAYLKIPELNRYALQNNNQNIKYNVLDIGTNKIESITNRAIEKEIEILQNNPGEYVVLYHAHKKELIVLQDIYKKLYETLNKTKLNDFEFLRLPSPDFKFQNCDDFIYSHKTQIANSAYPFNVFDNDIKVNKHILSTNASMLGNSLSSVNKYNSECTFKYFARSSNITNPNLINLCENIFPLFRLSSAFNKYKNEISDLINLLAQNEKKKSGVLLQIFVPTNLNNILYRANPGGTPFYGTNKYANYNGKQSIELLENYTRDIIQLLHISSYFMNPRLNELDELQFRLLITNTETLNPYSGIKIIRYMAKTQSTLEYEKNLEKLINKISRDTKVKRDIKSSFMDGIKYLSQEYLLPFITKKGLPSIANYITNKIKNKQNATSTP